MKRVLLFIALASLSAGFVGCGGSHKVKHHEPVAQLVIPPKCVTAVGGTESTQCIPIDGKPDYARCRGELIVHFNCTKVDVR